VRWPVIDRPRPWLAIAVGIGLTVVLALVLAPLHDDVTRAVPALLLVVPVILATVLGGRTAGLVIAGAAALAFSLTVPPLGTPRVRLGEDAVALVVFVAVALTASALVTTKIAALHDVDEQRRALLRSVSHDLRTPLAAIHAVATDLRSGTAYDESTRNDLLDVMINESERLDRFVANLLNMSRIEAGTLRPDFQPVDVAELIDRSTERFDRLARHPIQTEVPSDLPFVRGDHVQLEQVLANLLDNAVRHAADSRVRVSARRTDETVAVTVADDGPGLPPAVRARLTNGSTAAGDGLGLAIVAAVVRLHGGSLTLADGSGGTAVTVGLPRAE
jgi:two-component system sensor histidine kinase KdpD